MNRYVAELVCGLIHLVISVFKIFCLVNECLVSCVTFSEKRISSTDLKFALNVSVNPHHTTSMLYRKL